MITSFDNLLYPLMGVLGTSVCPFAMFLRVFRSLLGLLEPLCGLLGWSWRLFGWSGRVFKLFDNIF